MLTCLLSAALVQAPQVQPQVAVSGLPSPMDALIKTKDWAGLADWFETVPPATRGKYYEWWIQSLNRSQRWDRLLVVCEALQSQLEAKSGPRLGTYRLYRAQALSHLGRHAEAARAHAENGRMGFSDGFPNACAEARLAQDWNGLLAFSEELLQQHPQNAFGLTWKGEALARMDRFADAEPLLRSAVERDPKNASAWNNLGRCFNGRQAWTEATAAFDKALALEPTQLEALFNRGRARFELKHYKESRDDFRAALALQPGNPILIENLRQAERYAALPVPKPRRKP